MPLKSGLSSLRTSGSSEVGGRYHARGGMNDFLGRFAAQLAHDRLNAQITDFERVLHDQSVNHAVSELVLERRAGVRIQPS